ncbi:MAG: hypothetical protein IT304_07290 [Dehalococcoidia bacterium]|nr:hypothetical protein [Dehalococcoidia bacterium]
MDFRAREEDLGGLREVRFSLEVGDERVPGLLVYPPDPAAPLPLVLVEHPATSSKDDYFVRDMALRWAGHGWACGGIDAPFHGERETYDPLRLFREPEAFPGLREQFARELKATVDALAARYLVDLGRLGYVGYSMGSMLGLTAVADDGRYRAAAFCLVGEGGLAGPASGPGSAAGRLGTVAVRVVGKLNDELIPRAATQALYDALPGEKDLLWLPGGHFEIGPDVIVAAEQWLRRHL